MSEIFNSSEQTTTAFSLVESLIDLKGPKSKTRPIIKGIREEIKNNPNIIGAIKEEFQKRQVPGTTPEAKLTRAQKVFERLVVKSQK